MGVVYRAEDGKLKRPVALKFLGSNILEDEEHKERFLREAQAAAALDHPNICTVYELNEVEGKTFLSMAYLEGQTVKEKIKSRPLKLQDALDIAIQAAHGLRRRPREGDRPPRHQERQPDGYACRGRSKSWTLAWRNSPSGQS